MVLFGFQVAVDYVQTLPGDVFSGNLRGSTIADAEYTRRYARQGYWMDRTLCDSFDEHVRERPDKTLIVAGSKRLSYREVAR